MSYLKHHITLLYLVCISLVYLQCTIANAQNTFCPPNLNFEQGNLSNWEFYIGGCCPLVANTKTTPVVNRHVLTSGSGVDYYGGFPIVAPGGGNYSLKLGNDSFGRQAERARYYIRVPNNTGNIIFTYRYAVVFEDPNHNINDQPRFTVSVTDSATTDTIACNNFTYISSSSLPDFQKSSKGTNVYYKPWTTASLNLTGHGGKTIAIDFASGDCALGAHFGYGYIDVDCGLFQVQAFSCNNNQTLTLSGPPGYKQYKWMDSLFTTVIDTVQNVIIPRQNVAPKYAIIVTPYQGFGCIDTFVTDYNIDTVLVTASAWPDTSVCKGNTVMLNASGTSVNKGMKYSWSPAGGLSCTQCATPFATIVAAETYTVIAEDTMGCKDTADLKVDLLPHPNSNAGPDKAACNGDSVTFNASGNAVSFSWSPTFWMSNANTLTPTIGVFNSIPVTYRLTMTNSYGCSDTDYVVVNRHPLVVPDAGPNIQSCKGDSAMFQASGGVSYQWRPPLNLSSTTSSTPSVLADTFRTYWVKVTNAEGCVDSDLVHINLLPSPTAYAEKDTIVCSGTPIKLLAYGGSSISWYPAAGLSNPNIGSPTIWPTKKITYNAVVKNNWGCRDTAQVEIDVLPKPDALVNNDAACEGDTVTLTASGGKTYYWLNNSFADPTSSKQTFIATANQTYTVEVANEYDCRDTADAKVSIHPNPIADAGPDTTICSNSPITLQGSGGFTYKWSPAVNMNDSTLPNPTLNIKGKNTFKLIVGSNFGCHDSDEVTIDVFPPPQFGISPDMSICIGEEATLSAWGGDKYSWYPEEKIIDNTQPDIHTAPTGNTRYYAVITENRCNNIDTLSALVTVNPLPLIKAFATPIDCGNETGTLIATGATKYIWSPADGIMNPSVAHTPVKASINTLYTVLGTDDNGCEDTASVLLEVYEGQGRLFIPDAFTPNGDGINDCYRVIVPGDVTEFQFSIYNRFGERVFHATDRNHCWDGKYKGEPAELSTYFYYYVANSSVCGRVFRKGDMHLLR